MEDTLKRIRLYTFIALAVVLLESLAGFSSLYTGVFYKDYDEETATETLTAIQQADPNYFTLLNDPAQPEFMNEFRRLHTTNGNMPLVIFGMMFIFVSSLTLVPLSLVLFTVSSELKGDEQSDGEKEDEKKEEEEDSF